MAGTDTAVVKLSELAHGQEADCFAALVKKEKGLDKHGNPFIKCHFRDRRVVMVAPLWSSNALREQAEVWAEGIAYRLHVRCKWDVRYGPQLEILDIRAARDEDAADGYDFADLVASSARDAAEMFATLLERVDKCIDELPLRQLVRMLLEENAVLFKKMPAAQTFHHSYTAGLLEHVWSMSRIAMFLADHYGRYYYDLNPPLNKGVILAAAILHDIGKLRELAYHPVETKYTKEGCLIGHVMIGRDLVREAAKKIDGFSEETLMLLEHAILAHHGKREFGAPVVPQTLEALLVSFVDDLDAKMNIAARERLSCDTDDDFTGRVFSLDNRRFYKGIPVEPPADGELADLP